MDAKIRTLRQRLEETSPTHDTAVGLVHPYWARKPLNIVEVVINTLSKKGDLVVDPFMGSGTTLYAALKNNRRAVGGDINPLSVFMVRAILEIARNGAHIIPEIENILNAHRNLTSRWFAINESEYIERIRYDVDGTFVDGNFTLVPTEVVTKKRVDSAWKNRKAYQLNDTPVTLPDCKSVKKFLSSPIDFQHIQLVPNSRIAIPKGARLSHYFSQENQASINALLTLVKQSPLYADYPDALMLIVSSSLPLLRLSDKKASSQWPYWRPKKHLTSRNPIMVLEDRLSAIKDLAIWTEENLSYIQRADTVLGDKRELNVHSIAAQKIGECMAGVKADLVLTDPPYGDQVPYIEYSSLWIGILGLATNKQIFKEEMVKSDAEIRKEDTRDYHVRLEEAFLANANILKDGGYMVWYYQDQDLSCWATIRSAAQKARLNLIDVIPLPKQRRSLKTVTSPNTTLDGDLLCIFKSGKTPDASRSKQFSLVDLKNEVKKSKDTYFDKYAVLISCALKYDLIDDIAREYKTVKKVLGVLAE
jgi:DNA modification methylase